MKGAIEISKGWLPFSNRVAITVYQSGKLVKFTKKLAQSFMGLDSLDHVIYRCLGTGGSLQVLLLFWKKSSWSGDCRDLIIWFYPKWCLRCRVMGQRTQFKVGAGFVPDVYRTRFNRQKVIQITGKDRILVMPENAKRSLVEFLVHPCD